MRLGAFGGGFLGTVFGLGVVAACTGDDSSSHSGDAAADTTMHDSMPDGPAGDGQSDTSNDVAADGTSADGGAQDSAGDGDASSDGAGPRDANLPEVDFFDADAGDGGACNDLANTATAIKPTVIVGTLPTGTGGTMVEGLYFLTAFNVYATSADAGAPSTYRETVEARTIGANQFLLAVINEGDGQTQTHNETVTFSGHAADIAIDCGPGPAHQSGTFTFDATSSPNRLHVFLPGIGPGTDAEFVLDLQ
jgi:hypothetical protein